MMKIAIDLEGTLIAQCGEFACECTSRLALCIFPSRPRHGARVLLRDLARAGHSLTLYTSRPHAPWRLLLWCRLAGLPVQHVLTPKNTEIWPPCHGFDLILDDDKWHIEVARQAKVKAIRVTNHTADWTLPIREATLVSEGLDLLTATQPA